MADIYNISREESDRWHAKKAVDRFLDKNGMYSHLKLDFLLVPEFLGMQLNGVAENRWFANIQRYDGKATINVNTVDGINRKTALAIGYCLAVDYYKNLEEERKKKNYLKTFQDLYCDDKGNISIKTYKFLGPEICEKLKNMSDDEKKAIVESAVNNKTDYEYYVSEENIDEELTDKQGDFEKKCLYFAEDLVSRDFSPRFQKQQIKSNLIDHQF